MGAEVTFAGTPPDQLRLVEETLSPIESGEAVPLAVHGGGAPGPRIRALAFAGVEDSLSVLDEDSPAHTVEEAEVATLTFIGRHAVTLWRDMVVRWPFSAEMRHGSSHALAHLRALRPISIARHVYDTGITAIPIVALIAFLISVIVAYMSAQQLRSFGAEIFVVDLVTIGVLRELGVLLTSIIVAGRSGSAFAAEIGSMKLNEEVDALQATGVDPFEALVLPRVLGLVIALPLLTVVADLVGLVGGAVLVRFPAAHAARPVRQPGEPGDLAHHLLGRRHQGSRVRRAHCDGRHPQGHAGARLLARARPAHHRRGRPGHLPGDTGRCALCGAFHGDRRLIYPVLEVRGLVNRFGSQVVHEGLDMEVREDEVFGIVGGSGTGKSVLLRSILGLQRPQAGMIRIEGHDITQLSGDALRAVKARYGVTFQQGALYSALNVLQNVQLPMVEHLPALSPSARDELAMLKIRLVGLPAEAARKYPAELSGGMVKRAALARALALDPRLLFLDEPTSGLDPIGAAEFDELMLYLQKQLRLTVVMITHDLDSIFRTCNRVGVIVDRRMETDTLERIVDHPNPWIQAYFHGERASIHLKVAHGA